MSENLSSPTAPEDQLVQMLLAGSWGAMAGLRRQWQRARISDRRYDEWGMVASIWLPLDTPPVSPPEHQFADVIFRVDGHQEWLTAMLLVERGVLTELWVQSVNGELLPRASFAEVSYCITVEDPADPMGLTVFPIPHRDSSEVGGHR